MKPRILVIDDTPDNLFLMNGLLEDRYEVVTAASGREGLQLVMSEAPPAMVLLDIMMPDMDGYEVLRRIRQHTPTATVPVIFLTALASQQDERLGLDLGAVDYLTKPVDPEQVILRIEAQVRAAERARSMELLSEKLARHLDPSSWSLLFNTRAQTIRFDRQVISVLHAESPGLLALAPKDLDRFNNEVQWLAMRHQGTCDPFRDAAVLVFFDDPANCVRMGLELQRMAAVLKLRTGIHTGPCTVATFQPGHLPYKTLVGEEVLAAALIAADSAPGSVALSSETSRQVQGEIQVADRHGVPVEDAGSAPWSRNACPLLHADNVPSSFARFGF